MLGAHSIAQNSLNNKPLQVDDSTKYSFLVSAHFYGGSAKTSGYPAGSVLGSVDTINNLNSTFLMCLGDMFMDVKNDIPFYKKSLFNKLNIPLYNAVGNHDLSSDVYQNNFGETSYSFRINNNIFLVLDTEEDDGSLKDNQLELLEKSVISEAKNIFVFSHRPIWAEDDEDLKHVFKDNTQSLISNNYQDKILPLLQQSKSKIYWFSGSLGGAAPSSFFYHSKTNQLTYIATAIRDLKRDGILKVDVVNDDVLFETISLTSENVLPLEAYNLDFWRTEKPKEFNYRLIPLYIKQIVFNKSFFIGVCIAFFLSFLLFKRFAKRK